MESIKNQIENIFTNNHGKIFSINDFYNLGTQNTIKSILYRLNNENKIKRLIDGLYTKPKYSKILEEYSYPNANEVAQKIAEKFSWNISPTGDTALNLVELSTQVPNEHIYISNGDSRIYNYRNQKIIFKHTSNRFITSYSKELSILIQSIKALGKDNISEKDIEKLSIFYKTIKENFNSNTKKLPFWIQEVLLKLKE